MQAAYQLEVVGLAGAGEHGVGLDVGDAAGVAEVADGEADVPLEELALDLVLAVGDVLAPDVLDGVADDAAAGSLRVEAGDGLGAVADEPDGAQGRGADGGLAAVEHVERGLVGILAVRDVRVALDQAVEGLGVAGDVAVDDGAGDLLAHGFDVGLGLVEHEGLLVGGDVVQFGGDLEQRLDGAGGVLDLLLAAFAGLRAFIEAGPCGRRQAGADGGEVAGPLVGLGDDDVVEDGVFFDEELDDVSVAALVFFQSRQHVAVGRVSGSENRHFPISFSRYRSCG